MGSPKIVGSFVSNPVGNYNPCCFKRRRWEKFANKHLELLWFSFFVTWTSFPSETHPTGDWIQVAASDWRYQMLLDDWKMISFKLCKHLNIFTQTIISTHLPYCIVDVLWCTIYFGSKSWSSFWCAYCLVIFYPTYHWCTLMYYLEHICIKSY